MGFGLLAAMATVALAPRAAAADETYRDSIRRWRERREERLRADGGWLSVVGLVWLKEGENRLGTGASCDIVLPPGSARPVAGVVELRQGQTSVRLEPGSSGSVNGKPVAGALPLRADSTGQPDVLELGRLSLHVIERGGRYGVRLKDRESPGRKAFSGLKWFEIDERYRVVARFVKHGEMKPLKVPNVLGESTTMPSPGYAEFTLGGKSLRLDGVLEEPGAEELFFILKDETSGRETYGGGRFLYSELPKEGKVILDFNKAYSPPCAFTAYATCPLPPPQNRLAVRVEAGERTYGAGH